MKMRPSSVSANVCVPPQAACTTLHAGRYDAVDRESRLEKILMWVERCETSGDGVRVTGSRGSIRGFMVYSKQLQKATAYPHHTCSSACWCPEPGCSAS
jgi:hypothetical protein